jgi:hypothetical protein
MDACHAGNLQWTVVRGHASKDPRDRQQHDTRDRQTLEFRFGGFGHIGNTRYGVIDSPEGEPQWRSRGPGYGGYTQTELAGVKVYGSWTPTRLEMNFVSEGPMNSTAIMRTVCIAITKETSTLLEAAMIAIESEPPGLVAR